MITCVNCGRELRDRLHPPHELFGPDGGTGVYARWVETPGMFMVCNEGARNTPITEWPIPHEPDMTQFIAELLEIQRDLE